MGAGKVAEAPIPSSLLSIVHIFVVTNVVTTLCTKIPHTETFGIFLRE